MINIRPRRELRIETSLPYEQVETAFRVHVPDFLVRESHRIALRDPLCDLWAEPKQWRRLYFTHEIIVNKDSGAHAPYSALACIGFLENNGSHGFTTHQSPPGRAQIRNLCSVPPTDYRICGDNLDAFTDIFFPHRSISQS